ncbi:MAG: hypothetical protein JNK37_24970 [Verrucomicrobiales bacterium]|nr:hypothetical protein [Verrucomicrobiales bacterium]
MRDLSKFFVPPFDDKKISLARQIAFSTDHLQRMSANNPGGELTDRITATTSALNLVVDCFGDNETKLAQRASAKLVKDNFRQTIPGEVARIMGAVVAAYGDGAPQVLECCPHGRAVFSQCRDDEVQTHLNTLLTGVTAHAADLGAAVVTRATNLVNAWLTIYGASEASTGAQTTTQEGKNLARENLNLMLFLNLLTLAMMFPRQPEKRDLYMRQDLLEIPEGEEEEEEEPEPDPNPVP